MNSLIAGLVAVIGALGGFYFGAKYGMGHPPASSNPTGAVTTINGQTPGSGATRGGGGGGTVSSGGGFGGLQAAAAGQITAVNGSTITVHDRQTGKDIKIDVGSARISKTTQGTTSDLTADQNVTVIGQTGSDGTVTAQVITIGGGGLGGLGGGRQGRPSPSPST